MSDRLDIDPSNANAHAQRSKVVGNGAQRGVERLLLERERE